MRQNIRILAAAVMLLALTASFLGLVQLPLAKWQFIPALLAVDVVVLAALLVLTVLLGRFYCSVMCPLGIFQDFIFWLKKKVRRQSVRFSYIPERRQLRYGVLFILLAAWAAGLAIIPALLDPYSIYGRLVTNLLAPVWQTAFNGAAGIGEERAVFLLAKYDIVFQGMEVLALAAVYFIGLAFLAWRYGRLYCNTLCPVGTMLGTVSRFSLFHMHIDKGGCVHCGRCERQCRSACIDAAHEHIDNSRCILCMECLEHCPKGAIHFSRAVEGGVQEDLPMDPGQGKVLSRRTLFITSAMAVSAIAAAMTRSVNPLRVMAEQPQELPVLPPGARGMEQFLQQCTACQLCISRCPQGILKPAVLAYGPDGAMKPVADYSRGYCAYTCHECGSVCPTGAIPNLSLPQKQQAVMGVARYEIAHCLIPAEGVVCGNCAVHCPVHAITMENLRGTKLPKIRAVQCIGCGSCQYHCPAMPKAIQVMGTPGKRP